MNAIKKQPLTGCFLIAYDSLVDQIFCRLFQLRKRFPFDLTNAFAGHFDVTRERIRQIEGKALSKLKKTAKNLINQ